MLPAVLEVAPRLEPESNNFHRGLFILGPPVAPFCSLFGEGSPTKIDYREKGALVLPSLLEDLFIGTVFFGEKM